MAVIRALGERQRLRIVRLLLDDRLGVNEIARRLRAPQYNVSKHLGVLVRAGLLDVEPRGRERRYGLAASLRRRVAAGGRSLELDCCTFRFDRMPR